MIEDKRVHALPALLIGLAAFLLFTGGGAILVPTNTDWLMSGDAATFWLSWQFFRETPLLQWPLGANPAYGMEMGGSIVFTDSIPLLALALKPFSAWLPQAFQYVGAWIAMCFLLQAWFAWKLLRLFVSDRWLALLGVAFFAIAPILALRLWGHYALMGHWMILAALYLYWRPAFSTRAWLLLLALATLINAYLLLMVLAVFFADNWQRCWLGQRNWRQAFATVLAAMGIILVLMWATGYFILGGLSGVNLGNYPYGRYHMNLQSAIDPEQMWSRVLEDRPGNTTDEYEGFAFLGSGMLLLVVVAIPALFLRVAHAFRSPIPAALLARGAPLLAMALCLLVIAVSNHVALGTRELFSYPLPGVTDPFTTSFRSSGRFAWPVYYLLYLGVIVLLAARLQKHLARLLLGGLLAFQLFDGQDAWRHYGNLLGDTARWSSPMVSPLWKPLAEQYSKLAVAMPRNLPDRWVELAEFAARNKMATHAGYFSRIDQSALARIQAEMGRALVDGSPDPETLYVIQDPELWRLLTTQDPGAGFVGEFDGFRLLAPRGCPRCDQALLRRAASTARAPAASNALGFRNGEPGTSNLLDGWWTPEHWGTWSDGDSASVVIDTYPGITSDLELVIEAAAFLAPKHPVQTMTVVVNGRPLATLRYTTGSTDTFRRVRIPRAVASARQGRLLVRFDIHDPASPDSVGLGADHRQLGLGLISIQVKAAGEP